MIMLISIDVQRIQHGPMVDTVREVLPNVMWLKVIRFEWFYLMQHCPVIARASLWSHETAITKQKSAQDHLVVL